MICTNCYYKGKPKMKGSILLALFLLVLFPIGTIIGIIYVVYQSINAGNFCPKCNKRGQAEDGEHLGIEITFDDLPEEVQNHVQQRLESE
jgi:hypothetical protein